LADPKLHRSMKTPVISRLRLQRQIDELAAITEAAPPVVTRILFSEADLRGRAFVKKLCREAGLNVREDAVGNIFACWPGSEKKLPPVATGSHIDAIPNAGKFDGVVGVLGALEAMRALKKAGFRPQRSIELIVFTAEEPTRFGIGCLGSRLLSGVLSPGKAASLRDRDGKSLDEWRAQAGFKSTQPSCSLSSHEGGEGWGEEARWLLETKIPSPGPSPRLGGAREARARRLCASAGAKDLNSVRLPKGNYSSFVELHIEQGPVLEREHVSIGVVEKIAAPSTLRMKLTGVGGHAGATLMPGRRDALLAGAEIALAVDRAVKSTRSPDTVGTTGIFRIEPGAVNSVPCRAHLEIDVRDTRVATRNAALKQIERAARDICRKRRIKLQLEQLNVDSPAICDPKLVKTIRDICRSQKISCKKMISRAYHDSLFMAQICSTTMIFIPCRKGYSHRPDEYSSPEQIEKGVQVLAEVLAVSASH
jgi:N-carbamoyl-L-amino-acid hydrolase